MIGPPGAGGAPALSGGAVVEGVEFFPDFFCRFGAVVVADSVVVVVGAAVVVVGRVVVVAGSPVVVVAGAVVVVGGGWVGGGAVSGGGWVVGGWVVGGGGAVSGGVVSGGVVSGGVVSGGVVSGGVVSGGVVSGGVVSGGAVSGGAVVDGSQWTGDGSAAGGGHSCAPATSIAKGAAGPVPEPTAPRRTAPVMRATLIRRWAEDVDTRVTFVTGLCVSCPDSRREWLLVRLRPG